MGKILPDVFLHIGIRATTCDMNRPRLCFVPPIPIVTQATSFHFGNPQSPYVFDPLPIVALVKQVINHSAFTFVRAKRFLTHPSSLEIGFQCSSSQILLILLQLIEFMPLWIHQH